MAKNIEKIESLSKREVEIIAWLEFYDKYFFSLEDIENFFSNKTQRYNTIKSLVKKKRIVKINKGKYYLIPIKAKSGKWTEDPFIIIDEIVNGNDYYIGGWGAANYWRLTDQIPFRYDVYTTRRQGKYKILGVEIFFHRTTKKNISNKAIIKKIQNHDFKIINKRDSKKWMKLKE